MISYRDYLTIQNWNTERPGRARVMNIEYATNTTQTFEERFDALMKRRRAHRAPVTFDALGSRYYESLE